MWLEVRCTRTRLVEMYDVEGEEPEGSERLPRRRGARWPEGVMVVVSLALALTSILSSAGFEVGCALRGMAAGYGARSTDS